jgi:histidinol-phosphatase
VSRDLAADLGFALSLADAADEVTLSRFGALDLHVETKPDLTPVSEADRGAEELIRQRVAAERAGESVFGEEYGDGGGDVRWIVDPIDGTRSYVRGIPVWATLLALEVEGSFEVAVVSAPALGRRWWATRGGGAFADGTRLNVSGVAAIEDATVSCTTPAELPAGWSEIARRAWATRGWGDFWQHCLIAEGALDLAAETGLQLWDYAAVALLVEEAGGRCTSFAGGPLRPGETTLSSNGLLHDEAVRLLSGRAQVSRSVSETSLRRV